MTIYFIIPFSKLYFKMNKFDYGLNSMTNWLRKSKKKKKAKERKNKHLNRTLLHCSNLHHFVVSSIGCG